MNLDYTREPVYDKIEKLINFVHPWEDSSEKTTFILRQLVVVNRKGDLTTFLLEDIQNFYFMGIIGAEESEGTFPSMIKVLRDNSYRPVQMIYELVQADQPSKYLPMEKKEIDKLNNENMMIDENDESFLFAK